MPSIFEDKSTLNQEYKRLFLYNLTSLNKVKECINGRYDHKNTSDEDVKQLLTNNHKIIYDFVGVHNEHRIRYFFGADNQVDSRDSQIRLADRLILDSLHFEVMNTLITRLNNEYPANQTEIDRVWHNEIQNYSYLGPIDSIFIIQKLLPLNKQLFFKDLKFPKEQSVTLFSLSKTSVVPNYDIFASWIFKPSSMDDNLHYFSLTLAAIAAVLILTPFIFAAAIGYVSVSIVIGIIASLMAVAGMVFFSTSYQKKNTLDVTLNEKADESICCPSHVLMKSKMPSGIPSLPEDRTKQDKMHPTPYSDDLQIAEKHIFTRTL